MNWKTIAATLVVMVAALSGCATASTDSDLTAVHYSGGVASEKKFQNCLKPSSRSGYDPGDGYYAYPTRQVSYDATGGKGSEAKPFRVVSKDNAEMATPVTVTFSLKTDCDTLRKFHEALGNKYEAYFDANGKSSDENEGWVNLLNFVIGKPLDATLDRFAQKYTWRELWNDPTVKTEIETAINDDIEALVTRQAGGAYFENFQALVQKPDPTAEGLKTAIAKEQEAVADAQAAEKKAEADVITARAQVEVARAEALKKKAEISGFGGIEEYLRAQCIASGCNPYQPTWIYGGAGASKP